MLMDFDRKLHFSAQNCFMEKSRICSKIKELQKRFDFIFSHFHPFLILIAVALGPWGSVSPEICFKLHPKKFYNIDYSSCLDKFSQPCLPFLISNQSDGVRQPEPVEEASPTKKSFLRKGSGLARFGGTGAPPKRMRRSRSQVLNRSR